MAIHTLKNSPDTTVICGHHHHILVGVADQMIFTARRICGHCAAARIVDIDINQIRCGRRRRAAAAGDIRLLGRQNQAAVLGND